MFLQEEGEKKAEEMPYLKKEKKRVLKPELQKTKILKK